MVRFATAVISLCWSQLAFAGLTFWNGPGYGQDTYTGTDGTPGLDGKGVEIRGSAPYGQPGVAGNSVTLASGETEWAVFQVVSDVEVQFGRMKVYVCDGDNGWRSYSMLEDSSYTGTGFKYWYQLDIGDQSFNTLPVTDNISYFFQENDNFTCLPATACANTPLSTINECASTFSRSFLAAPDVDGETPFEIVTVDPMAAGQVNEFVFEGAAPNTQHVLVGGRNLGSTNVPGCPGLTVDIDGPTVLQSTISGAFGEGVITQSIPSRMAGTQAYVQIVDRTNCVVTPRYQISL